MDTDYESRIVAPEYSREDGDLDLSLRPRVLSDYIGQEKVKENLSVYIQAAKKRGECLFPIPYKAICLLLPNVKRDFARLRYHFSRCQQSMNWAIFRD